MAKRFGRQQRRKMREQMESLSAEVDGLTTSLGRANMRSTKSQKP